MDALFVGSVYGLSLILLFVFRSKMKIEDIKEANKALQVLLTSSTYCSSCSFRSCKVIEVRIAVHVITVFTNTGI